MGRMIVAAVFALSLALSGFQQTAPEPATIAPEGTPILLGMAGYAKVLCSAVFVSGRDDAEAFRNSGYMLFPEEYLSGVHYVVDRDKKLVRMTHGGTTRMAKFYGDQGCIIQPENHDGIFFTPVSVRTRLPDASSQAWPMGDKEPDAPAPADLDRGRAARAVDAAFADPEALTAAFVVVYKGRIVAERYMPGITKDTQLESWSMGKSLTATLFALLVRDG